MPSAVPAPLASIAARLRCPACHQPLALVRRSLTCRRGHNYDVAGAGYVTLNAPDRRPAVGDDAGMLAARAATEDAGRFGPLTAALAAEAQRVGGDRGVILDVGAGTGHHLARLLDTLTYADGVALDASRDAARRAARAHARIAAVRSDVWQQIPLGTAEVDLALSVFAPRNAAEFARVLRPAGVLIVATPEVEHLRELAMLHNIRVDPRKAERIRRQLGPPLHVQRFRRITWTLELSRQEAGAMLRMGPAGRHLRPDLPDRLDRLQEPIRVTAAVQLRTFQRSASPRA